MSVQLGFLVKSVQAITQIVDKRARLAIVAMKE